ncbi:MAG: phosphate acetyltransferase [Pseudomonadota bacterium]
MQSIVEPFTRRAAARNGLIVYPEGTDTRIVQAVVNLQNSGLSRAVLLGKPDAVAAVFDKLKLSQEGIEIIDPAVSPELPGLQQKLLQKKPDMDPEKAAVMVRDPLYFGGAMVASGQADAMIAGAANATGKVISASLRTVGLTPGTRRLSSYFLMSVPNHRGQGRKDFLFADCAVNIDPPAEDLAEIAIATGKTAANLLPEPAKVALLSFSTKGSAAHEDVTKVTEALAIVRKQAPELAVDGELQVDAALVPSVAERKVKGDAGVAGEANVLVFPDLNSGNIGYKLVQYMGNADAIGPFFQGFDKPVCDLSRGCSVDDVMSAAVILMATA